MKPFSRIIPCGAISDYNSKEKTGLKNWIEVISNRIQIKSFVITDVFDRIPEFSAKLIQAINEGKLKLDGDASAETVIEAKFEDVPKVWMNLFTGGNQGKLITKILD